MPDPASPVNDSIYSTEKQRKDREFKFNYPLLHRIKLVQVYSADPASPVNDSIYSTEKQRKDREFKFKRNWLIRTLYNTILFVSTFLKK